MPIQLLDGLNLLTSTGHITQSLLSKLATYSRLKATNKTCSNVIDFMRGSHNWHLCPVLTQCRSKDVKLGSDGQTYM